MRTEFTTEQKEQLEYLLSLEKATRVLGKSYEDMARNYNHSLQDGGVTDKFIRYANLHTEIISRIENYLDENVG
jgi:hypothetical protein